MRLLTPRRGHVGRPAAVELDSRLRPEAAAEALLDLPGLAFLDSSLSGGTSGRYSYVAAAPATLLTATGRRVRLVRADTAHEHEAHPFEVLRPELSDRPSLPDLPPFQGGAIGYFGYELRHHFERGSALPPDPAGVPDLVVGVYDWVLAWDHAQGRCWLVEQEGGHSAGDGPFRRGDLLARLASAAIRPAPPMPGAPGVRLHSNFTRRRYLAAVRRAQEYIAEGDIYQVNLSQRFRGRWPGDTWALYRRLRAISPAPYAAYLSWSGLDGVTILSASPERFLRLDGRAVETRPIKGTRPRGRSPEDDARLAAELLASVKDRAENVMIVDLLRNDLGRVCRIGSIRVPRLFDLEGYAQVWQLVSTVAGQLNGRHDALGLLAACFPGGSVTGCPKIRAMEIIAELEATPRGVYCGAIGYLGHNGAMDTSIVIRTVVVARQTLSLQVGGAVVADSDAEQEYAETLAKAAGAFEALGAVIEDA
ncbi:MAG: aminodeoxychorismate synthase component I [Chloroflexi bacterium]|nr:aminodeoxychorismate synthase component I [Chloroflexota bacterium]